MAPPVNQYTGMLKQAQDQYAGILQGYQRALAGQQARSRQISQGYNQLQSNVLGQLAGAGAGRSQEIADYYTQASGRANQDLINRGLGNTTVASSVGRGLGYDQAKAQTALSGQLAGQMAQYQSQLGLAGLGYRDAANRQNTALMGQQLGYQGDWQGQLLRAGQQQYGQPDYAQSLAQSMIGIGRGGGGRRGGDTGYGAGIRAAMQPGQSMADQNWQGAMRGEQLQRWDENRQHANEYVDLNAGMGYNPFARPAANYAQPSWDVPQSYYDQAFSAAGVSGY